MPQVGQVSRIRRQDSHTRSPSGHCANQEQGYIKMRQSGARLHKNAPIRSKITKNCDNQEQDYKKLRQSGARLQKNCANQDQDYKKMRQSGIR
jgi:hypothetical protein